MLEKKRVVVLRCKCCGSEIMIEKSQESYIDKDRCFTSNCDGYFDCEQNAGKMEKIGELDVYTDLDGDFEQQFKLALEKIFCAGADRGETVLYIDREEDKLWKKLVKKGKEVKTK